MWSRRVAEVTGLDEFVVIARARDGRRDLRSHLDAPRDRRADRLGLSAVALRSGANRATKGGTPGSSASLKASTHFLPNGPGNAH